MTPAPDPKSDPRWWAVLDWLRRHKVVSSTSIITVLGLAAVALTPPPHKVMVVNVIPAVMADDEDANSEPFVSVNASNPDQLVVTAHALGYTSCDPDYNKYLGLVVSEDGGKTWDLSCLFETGDQFLDSDPTSGFAVDGRRLYVGYLDPTDLSNGHMTNLVVVDDLFDPGGTPTPGPVVAPIEGTDQPWIATSVAAGSDVLAVAMHDVNAVDLPASCFSGVVYRFDDGVQKDRVCVARRKNQGNRTEATRVAVNEDGTAYAILVRALPSGGRGDIVVMRDDGDGGAPFEDLLDQDPGVTPDAGDCMKPDGGIGYRVSRCTILPYDDPWPPNKDFGGQRRIRSQISVAIDPGDSERVFVAWGDSPDTNMLALHVRASKDGGATWDHVTDIASATNPALAVDSRGRLGFLYQAIEVTAGKMYWETVLEIHDVDKGNEWSYVLAHTLANEQPPELNPLLGDYLNLVAVGTAFFGVFSAVYGDVCSTFPSGLQAPARALPSACNSSSHTGDTGLQANVDPFFVKVMPRPLAAVLATFAAWRNSVARWIWE